ncbi:MAG: DinB family protein [FCB group bacterium]|jgi:uncharacterized damage-inducible protein DinB
MTKEGRTALIESYGNAYDKVIEALKEFPKEMWQYKPAPEKWSIHQIIIHLADSEANSFIRCRRFIAEPGSGIYAYEQDNWANTMNYHAQSTDDALELFKCLRKMTYDLIKNLDDKVWSNTVEHSKLGTQKMEEWLKVYEHHPYGHIGQMKRNYDEWKAKR